MKAVSQDFKQAIKQMGRQIDTIISYVYDGDTIELGKEDLNSVNLHYEGNILKSVMKQLDIDSNVDIPLGTILEAQFGVLVDGSYEYISLGNFIVYSSEKQEDLNSYKIVCYDNMLNAMVDYVTPTINGTPITYPITIRNYLGAICSHLGLTFASVQDNFANYDKQIPRELYLDGDGGSLGYIFRDVLDQLAQVTASTICINDDGELEIRYLNDTEEIIDGESLKDINVNFGEKYGAVNTIVASRSAGSDNVYYPDPLPSNPVEIKISDNQILNGNDRADYLPAIYNVLNGLEFHLNDYVSTGITYLDLCDRYDIEIDGNTYNCVMLNDEIQITQGLVENIHTDLPEESVTDYNTSSKDDRTINRTTLIVDKQNQTITGLVNKTEQLEQSIEILSADLDTNVIVIPVDSSNVPFTTKTYTIDYRVKYLGNPITSGYTISTTDTHTGITTNLTTLGTLQFSVSNSTAISSIDNKYTFTISYVVGQDTYSVTKSVMLSLISSESEQNVVISDTAPSDTDVLWLDSSTDQLKRYIDGEWLLVNDFSSDINSINANISTLSGTIQDNYNELNGAISNLSVNVSTQFQQTTDSFNASISRVTNDINDKDSATNTRIDDIQSYLSYALEEVYNPITQTTSTTGVVTIGEANSDIKLKLANNILFFDVKGQNAGYLGTDSASNSKLYFVDANLLNSVRIGNYQFIPRTNGSLSFRKVD